MPIPDLDTIIIIESNHCKIVLTYAEAITLVDELKFYLDAWDDGDSWDDED